MIINHNLMASNAIRNSNINTGNASKSMEKLSSGLRINRAGDDAAGLAISEKMRGQIRGLDQASSNAQDGISMIQTAEGALNETHSILQRMRELSVQSSTDTNTPADRLEVQKEVDQLSKEISRISDTTQFNTQKLLDGTFTGTFQIGANANQAMAVNITDMRSNALGLTGDLTINSVASSVNPSGVASDLNGTYTVKKLADNDFRLLDQSGKEVAKSTDAKTYTNTIDPANTVVFDDPITFGTIKVDAATSKATAESTQTQDGTVAGVNSNIKLEAGTYTYDGKLLTDESGNVIANSTDGKTFKYGTTTLAVLNTAVTAGNSLSVHGVDVTDQADANKAITTIQKALDTVSTQRSSLGAYQNRLEHTINNLGTSSENLSAAESRIRDVDMAKEMSTYSKNNILAQAAQAMLAQANQQPQQVLSLLR